MDASKDDSELLDPLYDEIPVPASSTTTIVP
jgi:hypothetical protein